MTKKQIKKLITTSYLNNKLNSSKVNRISKLLTRSELKLFIKLIKNYEKSKTVTIFLSELSGSDKIVKQIKKSYPKKNLIIKNDPSLIGGIRIIDNDTIYDANIKNSLSEMLQLVTN